MIRVRILNGLTRRIPLTKLSSRKSVHNLQAEKGLQEDHQAEKDPQEDLQEDRDHLVKEEEDVM